MPAGPPPAITQLVGSGADGTAHCGTLAAACDGAYSGQVAGFLSWWDGVELWLSGLGFVLQTIIVIPVVLGLAYGIAVLLDGALGRGIGLLPRWRHGDDEALSQDATALADDR